MNRHFTGADIFQTYNPSKLPLSKLGHVYFVIQPNHHKEYPEDVGGVALYFLTGYSNAIHTRFLNREDTKAALTNIHGMGARAFELFDLSPNEAVVDPRQNGFAALEGFYTTLVRSPHDCQDPEFRRIYSLYNWIRLKIWLHPDSYFRREENLHLCAHVNNPKDLDYEQLPTIYAGMRQTQMFGRVENQLSFISDSDTPEPICTVFISTKADVYKHLHLTDLNLTKIKDAKGNKTYADGYRVLFVHPLYESQHKTWVKLLQRYQATHKNPLFDTP